MLEPLTGQFEESAPILRDANNMLLEAYELPL